MATQTSNGDRTADNQSDDRTIDTRTIPAATEGAEHLNEDPHLEHGQVVGGNAEKDPDQWSTGGEAMTGAQMSYLKTLSDEAGEPFNEGLTKAEASKRIDELKTRLGR